jgi:WD40 repeat protein
MATTVSADTLVRTFAYPEGLTRLAFSHDGKHLFTAGADYFLRVYDANDERGEVEPTMCEPFKEPDLEVLAIDCSVRALSATKGSTETQHAARRRHPRSLQ